MDERIEAVLAALRARRIGAHFAKDRREASRRILELIAPDAVVGIGDSTTLRQLGVLERLRERGTRLLNPFVPKPDGMPVDAYAAARAATMREATVCAVFLTGSNALTTDGRLVNVDATGNRVAGMFWGHPLSIVVVGTNKLVDSLEIAFERIRTVIAPTHFHVRTAQLGGRKRATPCVATGDCRDCRSEDRGCNVFTIIEGKPSHTALQVVLVDEDLGLGFDPAWGDERIGSVVGRYRQFVWVPV